MNSARTMFTPTMFSRRRYRVHELRCDMEGREWSRGVAGEVWSEADRFSRGSWSKRGGEQGRGSQPEPQKVPFVIWCLNEITEITKKAVVTVWRLRRERKVLNLGYFMSQDLCTFLRSLGADSSSPQISAIAGHSTGGNVGLRKSPQNFHTTYIDKYQILARKTSYRVHELWCSCMLQPSPYMYIHT